MTSVSSPSSAGATAPDSSLAQFLIERAVRNPVLGNYFHWYLMVEYEDKVFGRVYARVLFQYMTAMTEVGFGPWIVLSEK